MGKLPAFQFYPADWRKDPGVQSLSYHDRGVWFEILCLMHESAERGKLLLNGQKMPEDALARLLNLDKQILTTTLTTLITYGVVKVESQTGILFSKRMVSDELLRQIRSESGKLGGNPLLKQKPTPSSSSSSSSSEDIREPKKKDSKDTRINADFTVSDKMMKWFVEKQFVFSINVETEKFVNHWTAASGKNALKRDWTAAWRNWMLNALEFKNGGSSTPKTGGFTIVGSGTDYAAIHAQSLVDDIERRNKLKESDAG